MKKLKYLIVILSIFFINISFASASNKINRIDIEAVLDEAGNGKITEVWDMKVDQGTEVYKPMGDLGNSKISNFTVTDENGNVYTSLSRWDTSGSLSSKAFKNGINTTSSGIELCWGMSSYGNHIYTISYDVTNMIYNTDDAQVLYWKFVNDSMDPAPKSFSVKVSGPNIYQDTLDVWGYGYKGYAYVSDGVISMSNEENTNFSRTNYTVLLVKYPLNTFLTDNEISEYQTFNDFYTLAEEGSYEYNYENTNINNSIFTWILEFFSILFCVFVWVVAGIGIFKSANSNKYIKKEIDKKNLNNFRDIPCDKNVLNAYFLSVVYNLNKKKEDLLGALLLKWLLDKKIEIVKQNKNGLFKNKEITAIKLFDNTSFDNSYESELYKIMITASGDNLLEENELKKWCKNNYSKFFKWFDTTKDGIRDQLISEGHITVIKKGKVIMTKNYQLDDHLYQEAVKLAGLKQYLIEFSRIKEKQPLEVNLWEYYLIYAQIFGLAKEVAKQFKDLYPELLEQSELTNSGIDYMDILWINSLSTSSVLAASSARSAAQSYSSGGGGFSSGGGGGGSFGGGSGGGCR